MSLLGGPVDGASVPWAFAFGTMSLLLVASGAVVLVYGPAATGASGPGGALTTFCLNASAGALLPTPGGSGQGPAGDSGGAPPGGGAPHAFPLGVGFGTNWTRGASHCYSFLVGYVASGLTIGSVGIEVKTFSCAPAIGINAILLANTAGLVYASEDPVSHSWGATSAKVPAGGDRLVLAAPGALIGDELVMTSSGSSQSFPIAGSGTWEGCAF